MNKRNAILLVILIALAVTVFLNRGRIHFDWSTFLLQLRTVSLGHLAAGVALIWGTFWLRAWRWCGARCRARPR